MNTKQTIRKILFTVFWLAISGGLLTLLIAANNNKKKGICRDYRISIKGTHENFFVDKNDVLKLAGAVSGGKIKDEPVSSLNLRRMEELLEDNLWIKDAELWFDNKDVLHISVTEREPVARIFTTDGNSFYIDSTDLQMPLSDKLSAKVPVFTSFPGRKILSGKDSLLLHVVKNMALYILGDSFWMSQVAQVDITPEKNFEMIPVVGNHIVKLGDGENIDKKFSRLFVFYKEVLSKTGFDKYSTVDVEYTGQVIGTKKGTGKMLIDSAQLRLNVEKLLKQIQQVQNDNLIANPLPQKESIETGPDKKDSLTKENPHLKKTTNQSTPEKKITDNPKPGEKKVPKAVMQKKN